MICAVLLQKSALDSALLGGQEAIQGRGGNTGIKLFFVVEVRKQHWILDIPRRKGATENAGVENAIRAKLQRWKMQEWKKNRSR